MTDGGQPYLEAKRTVDDRALNRRVVDQFARELAAREEPVRIVELGAGVGTMIDRLVQWDALPARVDYRAVDRDPARIERARERVPERLVDAGYEVESGGRNDELVTAARSFVARDGERRLTVTLEDADAFAIDDEADAVIGAAFFDLVDLESAVPAVADLLAPDGLLYAPITYDGGTGFAPRDPLDDRVERCYHRHMDAIRDGGSSRAGRALLGSLTERGWTVLATGGADWIVRPATDGGYPGQERTVVSHVLETVDGALAELDPEAIADDERERWLERRHRQLAAGDLTYVAHNLDVLARPAIADSS